MIEEPRQVVGPRPDLRRLEDLRVAQGDRDLRGEQLDQLELLLVEAGGAAEALERQHAGRARRPEQGHDDQAAVDGAGRPEVVDPLVGPLVLDEHRLVVLDDPGRDAGLARLPRQQVVVGVHAAGGQRDQQAGRSIDDLDRDVVALDEGAHPVGDLLQHGALVERREDRLGGAQELALGRELALHARSPARA